jgi:hypothetical protein
VWLGCLGLVTEVIYSYDSSNCRDNIVHRRNYADILGTRITEIGRMVTRARSQHILVSIMALRPDAIYT